jgi:hypothetical protein
MLAALEAVQSMAQSLRISDAELATFPARDGVGGDMQMLGQLHLREPKGASASPHLGGADFQRVRVGRGRGK